jgi:hypothetical protein
MSQRRRIRIPVRYYARVVAIIGFGICLDILAKATPNVDYGALFNKIGRFIRDRSPLLGTRKLSQTAELLFPDKHPTTKPQGYWRIYDSYFPKARAKSFDLVELRVFTGESLKIIGTHFFNARILGLDRDLKTIDFSQFPNLFYQRCDQSDAEAIRAIVTKFSRAPDIIIDDASHLGGPTLASFNALFPLLRQGGLYCIEDWATGYWKDWEDGSPLEHREAKNGKGKRFPSHDFGLVGVVKSLVDRIGSEIEAIYFHKWVVILKKSDTSNTSRWIGLVAR